MWQADNDRYALWRLEHEMGVTPIDRLLDCVTATDRAEAPSLAGLGLRPVAAGLGHFFRQLCSRTTMGPIVPRASE